jgi:hypothetical protein
MFTACARASSMAALSLALLRNVKAKKATGAAIALN